MTPWHYNKSSPPIHLSIHPSTFNRLSRSRWQQPEQGSSDVLLTSLILQLFLGGPEAFPHQMGYIIPPAHSGFSLWSQDPKTHQLAPFDAKEKLSYSKLTAEFLTLCLRMSPVTLQSLEGSWRALPSGSASFPTWQCGTAICICRCSINPSADLVFHLRFSLEFCTLLVHAMSVPEGYPQRQEIRLSATLVPFKATSSHMGLYRAFFSYLWHMALVLCFFYSLKSMQRYYHHPAIVVCSSFLPSTFSYPSITVMFILRLWQLIALIP